MSIPCHRTTKPWTTGHSFCNAALAIAVNVKCCKVYFLSASHPAFLHFLCKNEKDKAHTNLQILLHFSNTGDYWERGLLKNLSGLCEQILYIWCHQLSSGKIQLPKKQSIFLWSSNPQWTVQELLGLEWYHFNQIIIFTFPEDTLPSALSLRQW